MTSLFLSSALCDDDGLDKQLRTPRASLYTPTQNPQSASKNQKLTCTFGGRAMVDHNSSKHLVGQTLLGRPVPRAVSGPLAVHYCARLAGVSMREYTLNPRTLADCVMRYYETFRPDAIWLSADTWVTAQAMGAAVAFPTDNQPMAGTGEPCVRSAADIDRIPPPDPGSQGRWPMMLEAMRHLGDALGKDVFIVACFDQYPFSLACALMGIEQVMTALMDDRPMVEALMARCAEYSVAYAAALAEAGADMLSGGDSPAGLIGPRLYREVALPLEQRVIAAVEVARFPADFPAHLRQRHAHPDRHGRLGGRRARTGSSGRDGRGMPDARTENRHLGQSRSGGPAGSRHARGGSADDHRS